MRMRRGGIRLTGKGLRYRAPSVRIGGHAGVNVSRSGVSTSYRGKGWSHNSRRGLSLPGCLLPITIGLVCTLVLSLAGCGTAATPTPDVEGTKQAMFALFAATMTAVAPTATATPTGAGTPTATQAPPPTATPTQEPILTATATPTPTATQRPSPTAEPTPVPTSTLAPVAPTEIPVLPTATAQAGVPTVAPTSITAPADALTVSFTDLHYECQMRCVRNGARPDDPPFFAYRSFQVLMQMRNNTANMTIDWDWEPARWFITDGTNTRVATWTWEWLAAPGEFYDKPLVAPGGVAEWTFIIMPIDRSEWVSAIEFEAWGHVYRQELDLGPFRSDFNYVDCGEPLSTKCG
ncbi:MAG: DUF4236 domain-containing protein [Anaerolineae bacterium]